jgi:hypothetical protein
LSAFDSQETLAESKSRNAAVCRDAETLSYPANLSRIKSEKSKVMIPGSGLEPE